jgi:hypothetical protein
MHRKVPSSEGAKKMGELKYLSGQNKNKNLFWNKILF